MIATSIVRVLELIFSVIVLALSITAVRWQVYGHAPASSGYNSFAGAWGVLFSLIGLVAVFVSTVPGLIMAAFDVLTFIILLAGGIAYAVQLRGVNCGAYSDNVHYPGNPLANFLLSGGYVDNGDNTFSAGLPYDSANGYNYSTLKGRCNTVIADDAFLFLAAIASLAAAVLVFIAHRRGGTRHSAV